MADTGNGASEPPHGPRRGLPKARILLVLLVVAVVIGATLFVLSLPPALAIHEGSVLGQFLANFPTTNSATACAYANFTATSYANQTAGPSSSLTMSIRGYGFSVGLGGIGQGMQLFFDITVHGRFASNIHPDALQLAGSVTGSDIMVDFDSNPTQGANVSANRQQTFAATDNGTGILGATLANAGGPGPFYVFDYGANGNIRITGYQATQFLGFRASVTGWMLPPIRVGIVVRIMNVPRTFVLYPAGTSWAVSGYNYTGLGVPTAASFTVAGALNASAPITAYITDSTGAMHWESSLGPQPTRFNVTLPPPGQWYQLFFTTIPPGGGPGSNATVFAAQDIVATT